MIKLNLTRDQQKKRRINLYREGETYAPGAEGRGRSEGMEPPWKALRDMVDPVKAFFFDILSLWLLSRTRYAVEEDDDDAKRRRFAEILCLVGYYVIRFKLPLLGSSSKFALTFYIIYHLVVQQMLHPRAHIESERTAQ